MRKLPPSNIRRFLSDLLDRCRDWQQRAMEGKELVQAYDRPGAETLRDVTRCLDRENGLECYAFDANWFYGPALKRLNLEDLAYALETAIKSPNAAAHYVTSIIERTTPLGIPEQLFLDLMPDFEKGAAMYGFNPGPDEQDEGYLAAQKLAEGFAVLGTIHREINATLPIAVEKIRSWLTLANSLDPHKWRPEFEPVETLWHASLYSRDILQRGFYDTRPKERAGLGSFGHLPLVSLTAEVEIAVDAANLFHTAWHISHGYISAEEMLEAFKKEGIDKTIELRSHLSEEELAKMDSPLTAIRILKLYMYGSQRQNNPVMVDPDKLFEALQNVKLEDIGIVTCRATLEPTTEYLIGEAEFRVEPRQISEVHPFEGTITGLAFARDLLEQRQALPHQLNGSKR